MKILLMNLIFEVLKPKTLLKFGTHYNFGCLSALSAFCLGNGDVCKMNSPELHDNIENKSFILTNEVRIAMIGLAR